jgi:hypothetical protein
MIVVLDFCTTNVAASNSAGTCHFVAPFFLDESCIASRIRTRANNSICHCFSGTCLSINILLVCCSIFTGHGLVWSSMALSTEFMLATNTNKKLDVLRDTKLVSTLGTLTVNKQSVRMQKSNQSRITDWNLPKILHAGHFCILAEHVFIDSLHKLRGQSSLELSLWIDGQTTFSTHTDK